jgi:alpha-1,3-rhamnosyl/mannosyltransferase
MRIIVEADAIAVAKMSGIGHTTLELLRAFDALDPKLSHTSFTAVVPYGKKEFVQKYGFKHVKVKQLPPGYKYINYALTRTSFPAYMDLLYGKGVYIFPNFKNWPLLFSKSISFFHDVSFRLFPESTQPQNLRYLLKNIPRWMHRSTRVVAISNQSKSEIVHFYPELEQKIQTIYLGADPSFYYRRSNEEIDVVKQKYSIKGKYFLAVGNIEPRKNIGNLLDGFREYVDTTDSKVTLVLVGGSGWNNSDILDKITSMQQSGYKVLRPETYVLDEDLPALYSGSGGLVQVAFHEGFGLSPVQALFCGVPMLLSDIPVLKEVIGEREGVNFVDPHSTSSIATGLSRLDIISSAPLSDSNLNWHSTAKQLMDLAGILDTTK